MTHTDQAIACVLLDRAENTLTEVLPISTSNISIALAEALRDVQEAREHITDTSTEAVAWSA